MSEDISRPDSPRPQATLCPYCGHVSGSPSRCRVCGGRFDPLSRQATQNTMGPWYVRDEASPYLPGCSYETIRKLVSRGKIGRATIMRGPTTRQFWVIANRVPGVAHLLGECHSCHGATTPSASECEHCGASFLPELDRQQLGLAPVHLLPGQATPEQIAAQSSTVHQPVRMAMDAPAEAEAHDVESPDSSVIDEIIEGAPAPKRAGSAGKVALGLVLISGCAALGWFGYGRAMLIMAPPAPPIVVAPEADEPTPEAVASIEQPSDRQPETAVSVNPELTVLGLLRDGRVEAARDALDDRGVGSGPELEAVNRRAERDRIRSLLTG